VSAQPQTPARALPLSTARRSDVRSLAAIGLHFGLVFAPLYLAAVLGPGVPTLLAWIWFGLLSGGALLVLHEAAHKLLLQDVRRNELLARWVLAPLFLADFEAFRRRHWAHHRELGQDGDPKYTYRTDISGWRVARLVLRSLVGREALRRFGYQAGEESAATSASTRQTVLAIVLVQGLLAGSLLAVARLAHPTSSSALLAAGAAYGFAYLYGLASLGVLMHALRGIVEHRPCDPSEPREHAAALRNFADGFVERWLFAPYGFVEHATHHAHPGVPYYHLQELTLRELPSRPDFRPAGGHWSVLTRLVAGPGTD
jgi:fatty acid desaturase